MNLSDAERSVGAASGKKYADCFLALIFREGAEEKIDRHPQPVRFYRLRQMQRSVFHRQVLIRGKCINAVSLDGQVVFGLSNFHFRAAPQNRSHVALVLRIQVLDHHESQADACGHRLEKVFQRLHPTSRGAEADYLDFLGHWGDDPLIPQDGVIKQRCDSRRSTNCQLSDNGSLVPGTPVDKNCSPGDRARNEKTKEAVSKRSLIKLVVSFPGSSRQIFLHLMCSSVVVQKCRIGWRE